MKVLDLQCSQEHVFEGWFGSEEDFSSQLARGLVTCPLCADANIVKKLSAPRLNMGARPEPSSSLVPTASRSNDVVTTSDAAQGLQAAWLAMAQRVLANTDDVGEKFAEEARKIHYGEAPERGIRGKATSEETASLKEEGISVVPLMLPESLKGPLQ